MSVATDGLTAKQRRFVDEYIVCLNGTEAARRAGYEGDDATLAVTASRLLRNAKVLRALDERLQEHAMPANEVLVHLSDIARGDIADALNAMGGIDPLEAKRRGKSHLIKRFKTKVTTITEKGGDEREIVEDEIELYSRLDALSVLAKFHGLLAERLKIEDWRSEVVALLQAGKITPEQVEQELGSGLAQELFASIGLSVTPTRESGEA